MTTINFSGLRLRLTWLPVVSCLFGASLLLPAAPSAAQRSFATPQEVIQATIDAADRNDTAALLQLFGPEGKDIVQSGNPDEDRAARAEFVRAGREKVEIIEDKLTPDQVTVALGEEEWPFPVPIVRRDGKWQLDSVAGRIEVLARRIGRNELNAIEACRGYAEAQLAYASRVRDGEPILKYAQNIVSSPGRHDGLYSDGDSSVPVPLAFANATVSSSNPSRKLVPYHGYYFRILKAQGPAAPGGAFNYVVSKNMIGGFALVAWPAEYGVTGIRTLVINQDGVVFEKDLGAAGTASQVSQMTRFNPDKTWHPVVLE
ncbi:DUF2950 domain-containing protein [Bryobacter aggregatus]|uniref:DUF2950 domain-containing protein n=1 Tax=Bryobacter aggregatus TaxID=360054 RepID=UPI0004E231E0|nr:DUF2950 domain-containing protein [Bryobacter aggregatus]